MKRYLLLPFLLVPVLLMGQQTDFIVLKKKNNRTLKTYAPGSFLSARTATGFPLNGIIQSIRHDSVYVMQEETRLEPSGFGTELDTLRYAIGIPYQEITQYFYRGELMWGGRRKSFSGNFFPRLLMIGGFGFLTVELVNTAYRRESITQDNKVVALGTAASVGLLGLIWQTLNNSRHAANGIRYKVIYVHAGPQ